MRQRVALTIGLAVFSGVAVAGPTSGITQALTGGLGSGGTSSLTNLGGANSLSALGGNAGSADALTSSLPGLQPDGNSSGFSRQDNGGTLVLDGSGFIDDVEPILTLSGALTENSLAGLVTAQESDDNASGSAFLSPERAILATDGTGDETLDTNRNLLGLLN